MSDGAPGHFGARNSVGVTGATGFIGAALVLHLARSCGVTAFSRRAPSSAGPTNIRWRTLPELGPGADFEGLFEGLDCLVHCAARVHVMHDRAEDPLQEFRTVNRDGTLALARAAAAAGVRRFVFLSSIKVNGEATVPGVPFGPDDEPHPVDPYGVSKLEAEVGLAELADRTGMELIIARPVLVYGPGVRANFAAIARLAATGLPLPLGRAHNRRSLVFLGNLVDLLAKLATGQLPGRRVFLPSDGDAMSTVDLVRRLAAAQGRRARLLRIAPGAIRALARLAGKSAVTDRLFGNLETDTTHLTEAGWQPPFSFEQGLRATLGDGSG
jgi:nucleoside-diphosphate-sugar epimerase